MQSNTLIRDITEYKEPYDEYELSYIDIRDAHNFLNDIRYKTLDINLLKSTYNQSIYNVPGAFMEQQSYEFILLALLYEYYYNYYTWRDDIIDTPNLKMLPYVNEFFYYISNRLTLNETEYNWIAVMIQYSYNNNDIYNKLSLLKEDYNINQYISKLFNNNLHSYLNKDTKWTDFIVPILIDNNIVNINHYNFEYLSDYNINQFIIDTLQIISINTILHHESLIYFIKFTITYYHRLSNDCLLCLYFSNKSERTYSL